MSSPVERFIRETLGCACPDAVFEHIDSRCQVALGPAILSRRINVGHRLLVYLLECDDPGVIGLWLPEVLSRGLEERDREGFNRLRVVVGTDNSQPVSQAAQRAFESQEGVDERVLLHVVDKRSVTRL